MQDFRCRTTCEDADVVLWMDFRDFEHHVTLFQTNVSVSQTGGDHLHRAIVAHPQEHAGGQQNFRFAILGGERLISLQLRCADRL